MPAGGSVKGQKSSVSDFEFGFAAKETTQTDLDFSSGAPNSSAYSRYSRSMYA